MKKNIILFAFSILFYSETFGQLSITTGLTPQQLASGIAGQGVIVSNVTFTGDPSQAGSFTATGTNLGIASGIMLATGTATFAIGPNSSTNAGTDMALPGDSTLDTLSGTDTHDACILEFDFMPQSAQVSFHYVFGSEEYPEYVCSQFNDVFAFYISGPGIVGKMNMALIPTTATPVAINSVNSGVIGANGSPGPNCGLSNSSYYVDNTNGATIELDGFTVQLTAQAIVQPCQMYHLRIMIADAGDGVWDSGVFIEQGSLFSNPVVNAGLDQTYCSGNTVSIGTAATANYTYHWIPATGLSNSSISNPTVTLTNPGSTPTTVTYVIIGNSGTCLFTDTVNITVDPAPLVTFTVTPSQVCIGQPMTVDYTGTPAANYNWNFGSATVLSGSGAGPYQIVYSTAIQDSISLIASNPGCSGTFGQTVTVSPGPVATFSAPSTVCLGDLVPITFTGNFTANTIFTWNFGSGQIISGSGVGPYDINWPGAGTQTITLTVSENGCVSPVDSIQVMIAAIPVVFAGNDITVCPGTPVALGGAIQPGFIYQWSPATGLDDPALSNPTALNSNPGLTSILNNYIVTITSPEGCTSTDDVTITVDPSVNVDFALPGVQCINNNNFNFSVQGAYPAGSVFSWDFGIAATPSSSVLASQPGVIYSSTGIYTVTLNASYGSCIMPPVSHSVEIFPQPDVDFIGDNLQGCSPLSVNLNNLSSDPTNSFLWLISNGSTYTTPATSIVLTAPGLYDVSLTATSVHGCSSSISKNRYIDVVASPISTFTTNPSVATVEAPIIFFQNNSVNAVSYLWNFGDSITSQLVSMSHKYSTKGTYDITLIAVNSLGCSDTSRGTVEINEGFNFYVPNAISPDGDGKNDYFQGYGINFNSYEMSIYNRWGEKIYETSEYFKPWDGRVKNVVQNDVYVYKIIVKDQLDEEHSYIGSVTVIK